MTQVPRRKFWPYDEVQVSRDKSSEARLVFSAPWLELQINFNPDQVPIADAIIEKLASGLVSSADVDDASWLFSAVAKYPFAYILPRGTVFGEDSHKFIGELDFTTPANLLLSLTKGLPHASAIQKIAASQLTSEWMWDADTALEFSQTPAGFDPEALFSVARRFHLLNDLDNNQTADLLDFMGAMEKESAEFKKASALVTRQNHYITQQCERVLKAALPISQSASDAVMDFVQAESGHDRILEKALKSLGTSSDKVPVLDCTSTLMELFFAISRKNFLAFAMIVDIFERTSYKDEDPFASVLKQGGAGEAAEHLEIHREINDSGGHENIALGFLSNMRAVDRDYATESLRMAELLTQVIHRISAETLIDLQDTHN